MKLNRERTSTWRQYAQANGLAFVPGQFFTGPSCYITGKYQDCSLALRAVQQGSGKSRRTYTHLELSYRNHQGIELALAQFPLGQQLAVKTVEELLISNPSFQLRGEIVIKNSGQDWSYTQWGDETEAEHLQELIDFLVDLIKNYPTVLALGGEAVTALHSIFKTKDHVLRPIAFQLLHDIAEETTSRLRQYTSSWFCSHCITGCSEYNLRLLWGQSLTYYGCRTCGQSREFLKGPLVAVLDRQMEAEQAENQTELRVNWLRRRSLYDFGRVEIIEATDEDVERFAVQVGNDTDEWRKPRYEQMSCVVSAQCQLSENTLRILERMFGAVKVETSSSPKIV